MNCLTGQFLLQRSIDQLMLLNARKAIKSSRNHIDLQMITTTGEILYLHGSIGNRTADRRFNLV